MSCFDILLAYPISERHLINDLNDKRIAAICRSYSGDIISKTIDTRLCYVRMKACDLDAAGILQDIPPRMYCIWVKFLRTNTLLYSYAKVTKQRVIPPRDRSLKKIYWAASQLERRARDYSFQNVGI